MSLNTNFNADPYWDDFANNGDNLTAEEKNYHRVLFKPSTAVQARELNQLQAILQNQIERFGNNIIKEGSIVTGGNFVEVNPFPYVKILDNAENSGGTTVQATPLTYVGAKAVGRTTGIEAIVVFATNGFETQEEKNTLYVKYINNAQSGSVNVGTFSTTEELDIFEFNTVTSQYDILVHRVTVAGSQSAGDTYPAVGNGYGVRCGDGLIYQKGHFIRFEDGLTIVSKYTTTPTDVVVGFRTAEALINSNQDPDLLDNAEGSPNENAPGADRLKLTPALVVLTKAEAQADETFFAIQEYQGGRVIRRRLTTQYNAIEKMIEKRTYEESGNYTVNDFGVKVIQNTANTSLLDVTISPGVAYVEGKRVELVNNLVLNIPDADTFDTEDAQDVVANFGHYVVVSSASTLSFDFSLFAKANLRDGSNNVIGSCRVRSITKQADGNFRLYIFEIELASGKRFQDVRSIYNGADENATLVLENGVPVLKDASFKKALYPIGRGFIKTINGGDTDFVHRDKSTISAPVANTATLTLTGETFPYSDGVLNSDQERDFIVIDEDAGGGAVIDISSVTISSGATVASIELASVPTGTQISIYHKAKISASSTRTKELGTYYVIHDTDTSPDGPWTLGVPDAFSLESVTVGSNGDYTTGYTDVTTNFTLHNNQKCTHYGLSYVTASRSYTPPAGNYLVFKFKAFRETGSASTFFCVNSYPVDDVTVPLPANKIRTEQIPVHICEDGQVAYLRDAIDFRPHAANTAAYATSVGSATVDPGTTLSFSSLIKFPAPNESIEVSYDYYLGRNDRLFIDEYGNFVIAQGEPADVPGIPSTPTKGMILADISVPPFPSLSSVAANRAGKPDYGVSVSLENNRRYTMRDIGRFDTRIRNLEYYTSLNLLEKDTKDLLITDLAGQDRFKNGILVDNFTNLAIAEVTNPEFNAALDPSYQELTPKFRAYYLDLKTKSLTSGLVDHGDTITFAKTDVEVLDQPYATSVRSCTTDFYKYAGAMQLVPEYDSAPDITVAPDVNFGLDLTGTFTDFTEALNEFVPLQRTEVTTAGTTTTTTVTSLAQGSQVLTNSLGDFVTDVRFDPFMRSREIQISATGLRPSTRFYFFFDGKDVNAHIAAGTLVSGEVSKSSDYGAVVTSNSEGALYAVFKIPAETFNVGERLLEIFDVPQYSSKSAATSYASRSYNAFNFSYTRTGLQTSTRVPTFDIAQDTQTVSQPAAAAPAGGGGSDPIAQTFIIDREESNDTSVMITKVDLYFSSKSNVNNGVNVILVETVNGYPSGKTVPFSRKHLSASEVNASSSSLIATEVVFDSPVTLKTETEYAIVVIPEANDPDYRVWIARTGEVDISTGTSITQDTNAGVLFTSTNGKAWSPYQAENLTFTLYRANYTTYSGTATLTNRDNEFLSVSDFVGSFDNDEQVYIDGSASYLSGTISAVAGNTSIVGSSTAFESELNVGDWIVYTSSSGKKRMAKVANIVSDTSLVATVPQIESTSTASQFYTTLTGRVSYFNPRDPAILVVNDSTASASKYYEANTTIVGLDSEATATITAVTDQVVSYIQPNLTRANFTRTSTKPLVSIEGTSYNIKFNDSTYFTASPVYVKSRTNEILDDGGTKSFEVNIQMAIEPDGTLAATSPMIDHKASNIVVYEYLVNNPSPTFEYTNDGDATSKYISKSVLLSDGLDALDLRVLVGAFRPSGGDIEVYGKFQSAFDVRAFNDIEWTKLTIKPETNLFSNPTNRFDYRELEYNIPRVDYLGATPSQGAYIPSGEDQIYYTDETGAIYRDFKKFAIKIVFLSSTTGRSARLKDMRAIAVT
jgi:hypothetical protein